MYKKSSFFGECTLSKNPRINIPEMGGMSYDSTAGLRVECSHY